MLPQGGMGLDSEWKSTPEHTDSATIFGGKTFLMLRVFQHTTYSEMILSQISITALLCLQGETIWRAETLGSKA